MHVPECRHLRCVLEEVHTPTSHTPPGGPLRPPKKGAVRGPWPLPEITPGLRWITDLANRYLLSGEASVVARIQDVVPGFKAGDPQDTSNYRFFALSCTLGKIVRRALADRLYCLVSEHLPPSYFGFVKGA